MNRKALAIEKAHAKDYAKHSTRNNKTGRNFTGLHIVKAMMGKMASDVYSDELGRNLTMWSLSTNALLNTRCIERIETSLLSGKDCICNHCFAITALSGDDSKSKGMARNLENNYKILTTQFLTWEDIPVITCDFFRFEAHGDTQNAIQLINYLMICEKALENGSNTQFAIWTKNPDIFAKVFNELNIEKPANLQILISSEYVNEVKEILPEYASFTDKVFTVWENSETAACAGHCLNCCNGKEKGRRCTRCQLCYTQNNTQFINEFLR